MALWPFIVNFFLFFLNHFKTIFTGMKFDWELCPLLSNGPNPSVEIGENSAKAEGRIEISSLLYAGGQRGMEPFEGRHPHGDL
jgi:hypothetical protein